MYYKTTAKRSAVDENGRVKKEVITSIVECEFYCEAELRTQEKWPDAEVDVFKQKGIKEIANEQFAGEKECAYLAKFCDVVEIDGKEKRNKYGVLVWADDINEAQEIANGLIQQGYNMTLTDLKETKITGKL